MEHKKYTNEEFNFLFAELKAKIKAEGLYANCHRRAYIEFIIVIGLLGLSVYSVTAFHPIITAFLFALTIMRATFVAHDLIHGQYFGSRHTNKSVSYVFANGIMGISRSWWENKHNFLHHTYTNIIGKDTDLDAGGGAFTGGHEYPRWFHNNQHILFWPLLTLLYVVFWVQSVIYVIEKRYWGELSMLVINTMIPVYIVYSLGWGVGLATVVGMYVIWALWFGAVIITNHLGLEMFPEEKYKDFTWLELQNRTSRNVRGGWFIHWFYGGLNTQVEHHLYPKAPRFYLLKAAKITEEFCLKHDITYITATPWETYKEIYYFLKNTRPKQD
ncbi:MAG TPA: acyl-CoA desaturase [Sulfurimonas sp.]|nr:acyl-CoA desaturase [Sulfurimonas sp.]